MRKNSGLCAAHRHVTLGSNEANAMHVSDHPPTPPKGLLIPVLIFATIAWAAVLVWVAVDTGPLGSDNRRWHLLD
jgi:hypothetical protein